MPEEIKKQEIKIEIDEQTANGAYANLALITHSETEFIMETQVSSRRSIPRRKPC